MNEQPPADEAPASRSAPGEVAPRRQLERPPSARFAERSGSPRTRDSAGAALSIGRGVPLALAIAAIGAVAVIVLYGVVATTFGLLAIAGTTGFLVGVALRGVSGSAGLAAAIAVGAMVLGIVGGWAISVATGGVAGPADYVGQTLGALTLVVPIVGGLGAWLGSR